MLKHPRLRSRATRSIMRTLAVVTPLLLISTFSEGLVFAAPLSPGLAAKPTALHAVPAGKAAAVTRSWLAPHSITPRPVAAPMAGSYSLPSDASWHAVGASGLSAHANSPLTVTVLDPATTARLGVTGLALRVTTATTRPSPSELAVAVPSDLLNGLFGADYAARAHWVALPDCSAGSCASPTALPTRSIATPTTSNHLAAATATTSTARATNLVLRQHTMILATASGNNASDGSGNFGATPLQPSSQWATTAQTGAFTWNYPMRVPPAPAGPSPTLNLSYDSSSMDGQTGTTNNQSSTIGAGWDVSGAGGFIERSYLPCSSSGGPSTSGDLCWGVDNATLSLAGHSGVLIKDATTQVWHVQGDNNTKIEHLTNDSTLCNNGTYDNDCWRVTTSDGTQYYFGRNHLPGWTSTAQDTQSAWTEPVYAPKAGQPCYQDSTHGGFAASSCQQAWRWNLDNVIDTHGNSEAFYYAPESNRYGQDGSTTTSSLYTRGGTLSRIDYGMRAGAELTGNAADQVVFTSTDRCETGMTNEPAGACSESTPSATYWPDVPWDQRCSTTACASNQTPTFWSIKRLTGIQTQYWNGSGYTPVDSWAFTQSWPDPLDGTSPSMQLDTITHTGLVGSTLALPAVRFSYQMKQNRVAPPNGIVPLMKPRLSTISLDSGGTITVNYLNSDCSGSSPAVPESNTKRCFPQYWAPPGQAVTLDWFEKYLVSSVNAAAVVGASPPLAGSATSDDVTTYDYSIGTPAWRFNTSPLVPDGQRTWSEFAGYTKVRVEHGDPALRSTLQTTDTTYFQGMDGDLQNGTGATRTPIPTLTSTDGTVHATDSPWFAGQPFETITYNGWTNSTTLGPVVTDVVTTPYGSSPTATAAAVTEKIGTGASTTSYVATARYLGTADSLTKTSLSAGGFRTIETKTSYDSLGRESKVDDLGDTSTAADDRCTTTSYADSTNPLRLSYVAEVATIDLSCASSQTPSYPTDAISDVRTSYDGQSPGVAPTVGDVTKTETVKDYQSGAPIWSPTQTTTYDALGRPLTVADALGQTTTTAYLPTAPAAGQPAPSDIGPTTQTTTTDPASFTTTAQLSPAWAAVTSRTDANNHTTTVAYDALGRTTGVWLPDRPQSSNPTSPSTAYAYSVPVDTNGLVNGPEYVATTELTPTGGTSTSYQIYDGLERIRQTQTPAEGHDATSEHAAPGSNGSDVTDTFYNTNGLVTMANDPYAISAAPSGTLSTLPYGEANVPGAVETRYDGAGRPVATITESLGTEEWRTSTAYGGDHTDTTPPAGGTASTTYVDARGNTTQTLEYHGGTPTGVGTPANYDLTTYTYWPSGRRKSMTDPMLNTWSWTYDLLGHQTSATDPDTGTTHTTYDDDGQVLTTSDADGNVLAYTYDSLGRKTAEYQNAADPATGTLMAAWTYDTLTNGTIENGQPATSTSYDGSTPGHPGAAYTKAITGYDANDRPLGTTYTLPATLGALAATPYTVTTAYNVDGSVKQELDPTAGGLPAETLGTGYTSLGNVYSYGGLSNYRYQTIYDALGRVTVASHYNSSKRLDDTYTYSNDGQNRLVTDTTVTAASTNNKIAGLTYTYDNAGNVQSAINTPAGQAADTQCFGYDDQQRLKTAWTPASGGCTSPSYSNLGGPAPYWQSYTYDAAGDRVSFTNHALSPTGTDQRDTYTYPTAGATAVRPNAVTGIAHATAPAGSSTWTAAGSATYGYDAAGDTNTTPTQTLGWNPEGKLASIKITSTGQTEKRIYDADGNLLVQSDPVNGTMAYFGDTEVRLSTSGTLTGQRIYSVNGQTVGCRTATQGVTGSTLTWQTTDPRGTSTISENPTTGATTTRLMDPFGSPRGANASWPTDRGFLNDPLDPFSAITHIGARDYNPTLGRFLSVDPVLNFADPQSVNGYAYARNSPITTSDPSGLCPKDICGDGGPAGNMSVGYKGDAGGTPSRSSYYNPNVPPPSANLGGGSGSGSGSSSGSGSCGGLPAYICSQMTPGQRASIAAASTSQPKRSSGCGVLGIKCVGKEAVHVANLAQGLTPGGLLLQGLASVTHMSWGTCVGGDYDISADANASLCWQATPNGGTGFTFTTGGGGGCCGVNGFAGLSVSNAKDLPHFSKTFNYVGGAGGEAQYSGAATWAWSPDDNTRQLTFGWAPGVRANEFATPVSGAVGRSYTWIGQ